MTCGEITDNLNDLKKFQYDLDRAIEKFSASEAIGIKDQIVLETRRIMSDYWQEYWSSWHESRVLSVGDLRVENLLLLGDQVVFSDNHNKLNFFDKNYTQTDYYLMGSRFKGEVMASSEWVFTIDFRSGYVNKYQNGFPHLVNGVGGMGIVDSPTCATKGEGDYLFVGGYGFVQKVNFDGSQEVFLEPELKYSQEIFTALAVRDGKLYVGTNLGNIYVYNIETQELLRNINVSDNGKNSPDPTRSIHEISVFEDTIAVEIDGGLRVIRGDNRPLLLPYSLNPDIKPVFTDRGQVCIAWLNELKVYDPMQDKYIFSHMIDSKKGNEIIIITSLLVDGDRILIGTSDGAIREIKKDKF
ncbi:MAG: PQQ-binding-like beta-propeller repeat protein [Candidatus Berkelbacteria bacterium]|nr:PQQ-binding-like beta-propeller repeat protein [Candidatus Berkelbacteria bacterium]